MDPQELQDTFHHFDKDRNGTIDFAEFSQLLGALDCEMETDARKIGFDLIDSDGNGRVSFEEFRDWWLEQSV